MIIKEKNDGYEGIFYSRCFTELIKVLGVECHEHEDGKNYSSAERVASGIWKKPPRASAFPIKIPNFTKIEAASAGSD